MLEGFMAIEMGEAYPCVEIVVVGCGVGRAFIFFRADLRTRWSKPP